MYGSFYITNEVRKIVWLKIEVENNAITFSLMRENQIWKLIKYI